MTGTFAALVLYAFVGAATPGPNNLMVMTSGLNFGVRRSLPHMLGITLGFQAMVVLIGLGLGQVFTQSPVMHGILKYGGAAYMIWLAWQIARAGPVEAGQAGGSPLTFVGAALFQWVNPKAWIMAVTAVSAYQVVEPTWLNAVVVAAAYGVVTLPSVTAWTMFGAALQRLLSNPRALTFFNRAMAMLLILSLWPVFREMP